jgi:hypothetical protein
MSERRFNNNWKKRFSHNPIFLTLKSISFNRASERDEDQENHQNKMFKPKFAPKLPPKKESNETATDDVARSVVYLFLNNSVSYCCSNSSEPVTAPKEANKDKVRVKKEFNQDRGSTKPGRGGNARDSGAGGRGQWTMPAGTAFFTGNAATQPAPKAKTSFSIPVVKAETSSSSARIYRPNEAIDELDQPMAAVIAAADLPPEPDLVDTDSDNSIDPDGGEGSRVSSSSLVWPPKRFHSLDPLSLPFGPKTVAMRKILNNEPILASPVNPVAMEEEERTALFLLQMPSDLR